MGALKLVPAPSEKDKTGKRNGELKSVATAARSGDRIATLRCLRNRIAAQVQNKNTPPRDLASLSKRLMEIMSEIEQLEAQTDQTRPGVAAVMGGSELVEEWDGV